MRYEIRDGSFWGVMNKDLVVPIQYSSTNNAGAVGSHARCTLLPLFSSQPPCNVVFPPSTPLNTHTHTHTPPVWQRDRLEWCVGTKQSGGDVVKARGVMLFSLITVILVTFWPWGKMITEWHHCVCACVCMFSVKKELRLLCVCLDDRRSVFLRRVFLRWGNSRRGGATTFFFYSVHGDSCLVTMVTEG